MKLSRSRILACTLLTLAAALLSAPAEAGVLAAASRVNNPFTFTYVPNVSPTVQVALDDAGNTSLSFTAPATQTVAITYSAECSSTDANTALIAVVVIDGLSIANGDGGIRYTRYCWAGEQPAVATRTVYRAVSAGAHTVQVVAAIEAAPFTGPHTATLEKSALVVMN